MNLLLLLFLKCKKWFETNKNCPTICFRKHKIIYLKGIDLRHMTLVEKYISCLSLFSFTFLFLPDNTLKNLKFETGNREWGLNALASISKTAKHLFFLFLVNYQHIQEITFSFLFFSDFKCSRYFYSLNFLPC